MIGINKVKRRWWLLSISIAACATNPQKGINGEHRAGLKVMVIYQDRDQILKSEDIQSKDSIENEFLKSKLPIGGRLLFEFKRDRVLSQNSENGFTLGGSNSEILPANEKTRIEYASVNIQNGFYYECESIEFLKRPFYFWSLFGFSEKPFQVCEINKPIQSNFDILLMNYEKIPIGKYSIKKLVAN